jgi:hypothetical protein
MDGLAILSAPGIHVHWLFLHSSTLAYDAELQASSPPLTLQSSAGTMAELGTLDPRRLSQIMELVSSTCVVAHLEKT